MNPLEQVAHGAVKDIQQEEDADFMREIERAHFRNRVLEHEIQILKLQNSTHFQWVAILVVLAISLLALLR